MSAPAASPANPSTPSPSIFSIGIVCGFGTAIAMWWLGYLMHLPQPAISPKVSLPLMFIAMLIGGRFATIAGGVKAAACSGLIAGLVNLLVVGSVLSEVEETNGLVPNAGIWVAGFLAMSVVTSSLGSLLAKGRSSWTHDLAAQLFTQIWVLGTLLLIVIGGLVTTEEAGMAVPDWPATFNSNMFLYPLEKMTGGVFLEHAHRLFGSLIGVTTVVAVFFLGRRHGGWGYLLSVGVIVGIQGILGGLRVVEDVDYGIYFRILHGVLGQLCLAMIVAIAVWRTKSWQAGRSALFAGDLGVTKGERQAVWALCLALVFQLALGAATRHLTVPEPDLRKQFAMVHMTFAVVVLMLGLMIGLRIASRYKHVLGLRLSGKMLAHGLLLQLLLGFVAFVVTGRAKIVDGVAENEGMMAKIVATAHQSLGALLLSVATALLFYAWRFGGEPEKVQRKEVSTE